MIRSMMTVVRLTALTVMLAARLATAAIEDFSDASRFESVEPARVAVETLERRGPTGAHVLELVLEHAAPEAEGRIEWAIPAEVADNEVVSVFVRPGDRPLSRFTLSLLDDAGNPISTHTFVGLLAERWTQLTFPVSAAGAADAFAPMPFKPGRKATRIALCCTGPQGQRIQVSALERRREEISEAASPHRLLTIVHGGTTLALEPDRGFALSAGTLDAIGWETDRSRAWPLFMVLDAAGKRTDVDAASPRCRGQLVASGTNEATVEHTIDEELVVTAHYRVDDRGQQVEYTVVREGGSRLVGIEQHVGVSLASDDYAITPRGRLLQPAGGAAAAGKSASFTHDGQSDYQVANMTAARIGDRIFFSKPLSQSNRLAVKVQARGTAAVASLGGTLFFRPAGVQDPATKLVHTALAWRFETTDDCNDDGRVDWVDCGIAYRDRYLQANRHLSRDLRENYIYYHQVTNYQRLVELDVAIDFAHGVWWVKNMLPAPRAADGFVHAPSLDPALGDLAEARASIVANGSRVGPHYSIDAIDIAGDWPRRFVKRGADGGDARYCVTRSRADGAPYQLHSLDYGRPLADGTFLPWIDGIMRLCQQEPGDVIMLDTFLCFARPGYDPLEPTTAETETAAKRQVALHLRDTLGLHVTAEGAVEGSEDVIEYTAGGYGPREWIKGRLWETSLPDKRVPLEQVLYTGLTYKGLDWYTLREGEPNYAAALLLAGKFWDWSSVNANDPVTLYTHCARRFFLNNVFWAQFADARIRTVTQEAGVWRIGFDNGVEVTTDPGRERFTMRSGDITYDGFTPFSDRGVMAVFADTSSGLVLPLPGAELELLPSQPHYDLLRERITLEKTPEGFVRVTGRYRDLKWKNKLLADVDGRERVSEVEVEPLLLFRRK